MSRYYCAPPKAGAQGRRPRRAWLWAPAFAGALGWAAPAAAQDAAVTSPGGHVTVTLHLDAGGRANYKVVRDGHKVLDDSKLGFLFTDAPKLDGGLMVEGVERAASDATWTQPWGEWATIRDHHAEMTVRLRERDGLKRAMAVTFRVFDDGVGFRYALPDQPNLHHANIAGELTEFVFAQDGTAWWKPAYLRNREEYTYRRTSLAAAGPAQTVMTVKLADGTHVALHEAALVDYAAMNLRRGEGPRTFIADLTPGSGAPAVSRDAGFSTPWRTIAIAPDAAGLYAASRIGLNLNEPNRLGDVSSWVRPGKYVGVWWQMISGHWSWAQGPQHGATNAHVRQYVDFAAANHIPGVLVEGWNIGWDYPGQRMEFDRPTPDFDADALAQYAKKKGVHLIGHNETNGGASNYDAQLDRAFAFAAAHGEPVVKTGYVAEAGQIERVDADGSTHREWHEGQWMVNHHARVVEAAARHHVSIDAHEPVKDTGLRRTWPNWLAREGGRGQEYNSWDDKNPPEHEANLVFTQLLGGPMDYTPGILSLKGSGGSDIPSTVAKQLALYVVLYSPVVMLADTPEAYAGFPEPMKFLRAVPTDWADTIVLNGEVGDYATIARKDRGSDDWYLGSIGDKQARRLSVTLDFLDAGRAYRAEIYRDAADTDYRQPTRSKVEIETRTMRKGDILPIVLAPGGGMAVRFVVLAGK